MNRFIELSLKSGRKVFQKFHLDFQLPELIREEDPQIISDAIFNLLDSETPCMIARFGSTELLTIVNYLGVKNNTSIFNFLRGKGGAWWWQDNVKSQIVQWSGFFPATEEKLNQFCEMMLRDTSEVDILGSWLANEYYVSDYNDHWTKVWQIFLDPFWCERPWTRVLKGKRVLIIHPFEEIIQSQYTEQRHNLFQNSAVLPDFELFTIKAVQSLGGESNGFNDWFDALESMKKQIESIDFDICLIGCGAYGFPLAAHVKRMGKKAVHIGGSLQLLFGIIGKRWEDPNYAIRARKMVPTLCYKDLINEHWIRPSQYKSKNSASVEGNCYW